MRNFMKSKEEYSIGVIITSIIALGIGMLIGGAIFMALWNGIICSLAAVSPMSYGQGMLLYLGIRIVWPTESFFNMARGED